MRRRQKRRAIRVWMRQLQECGSYSVGEQRREWLTSVFYAGCANDMETGWEIRDRFQQDQYLMDTHTAVGSRVLREYREKTQDDTPTVLVSTASPYKFAGDVLAALDGKEAVSGLDAFACQTFGTSQRCAGAAAGAAAAEVPVLHRATTEVEGMAEAALRALGG